MIKDTATIDYLSVAPTLAYDLLNDARLCDELWREAALEDPAAALAALTARNTMESLRPGSGSGVMAGFILQRALGQRIKNTNELKLLFS